MRHESWFCCSQCIVCQGVEKIYTTWALRSLKERRKNWMSTLINEDTFSRVASTSGSTPASDCFGKNKIVLDSALRLQSFRTPKTQQLVSGVGLNANNKSDGGPVPDSSRKLTASMNANMGELKSELTANKEELKSDLKGIGDKLTTMDKKFEEMEGRIESVENKFENKFVDIENKFENKFEDMESKLEKLKQKVMTGQGDEFKFQAPYSKPSIKLFYI
ncbi:uncharacterized protein TNCV_945031 [Trichonephila clavipes]|nr:uncharacterized protein TNCV_945031 [Trichonephila clavipes]